MTEDNNIPHWQKLAQIKNGTRAKECVPKPRKRLNPISPKKAEQIKEDKDSPDNKLDIWFEDRRKEMTGKCTICWGKSNKDNDETFRWSAHHLLDKRKTMFPSLALHPANFLEVCVWGNNCHGNLHNGTITWELLKDSAEWAIIKPKLEILLPLCTEAEKKNKLYSRLTELVYGK